MNEGSRARGPRSSSVNSVPLILDIEDFKVMIQLVVANVFFCFLNHKGF